MMKKLAAAGLSAALVLVPLAAFAQTDAAPAATDAAPAKDAGAMDKSSMKHHMGKKHHMKAHKKMMKGDAPASTDGAAPDPAK